MILSTLFIFSYYLSSHLGEVSSRKRRHWPSLLYLLRHSQPGLVRCSTKAIVAGMIPLYLFYSQLHFFSPKQLAATLMLQTTSHPWKRPAQSLTKTRFSSQCSTRTINPRTVALPLRACGSLLTRTDSCEDITGCGVYD